MFMRQPLQFLHYLVAVGRFHPTNSISTGPAQQLYPKAAAWLVEHLPLLVFAMAEEAQTIQVVYPSDLAIQGGGPIQQHHLHLHHQQFQRQYAFFQRQTQVGHQCYGSTAGGSRTRIEDDQSGFGISDPDPREGRKDPVVGCSSNMARLSRPGTQIQIFSGISRIKPHNWCYHPTGSDLPLAPAPIPAVESSKRAQSGVGESGRSACYAARTCNYTMLITLPPNQWITAAGTTKRCAQQHKMEPRS